MIITILTLFPENFSDIFSSSIIGRAKKAGKVSIRLVNIRDYSINKHHQVDDKPYGGGIGMILRIDVVERAISSSKLKVKSSTIKEKVILLDPKGKKFDQAVARKYSKLDHLILVCGHYEGVDERLSHFVDGKVSVGDFVLTGGEIPAMAITDAVSRLIPGVLAKKDAILHESFGEDEYLEEPQFTRPPVYKGFKVPAVLLSGNHKKIVSWGEKNRKSLK